VLQCASVCCSVLQYVAVCCSVLQCADQGRARKSCVGSVSSCVCVLLGRDSFTRTENWGFM